MQNVTAYVSHVITAPSWRSILRGAMARHYQGIEIQSARWNKGVENNLAYWNAAHSHLKDAMNRRTEAGDTDHSPFLKECVSLHEQIDGILAFYRTNQDIAKAYAKGDFSLGFEVGGAAGVSEAPASLSGLRTFHGGDEAGT